MVRVWMDLETLGYIMWTTGPQTAQGQSSQFFNQDEVIGKRPTMLKNVFTILSYFNRLAYNTLSLNNYLLTQLVHEK